MQLEEQWIKLRAEEEEKSRPLELVSMTIMLIIMMIMTMITIIMVIMTMRLIIMVIMTMRLIIMVIMTMRLIIIVIMTLMMRNQPICERMPGTLFSSPPIGFHPYFCPYLSPLIQGLNRLGDVKVLPDFHQHNIIRIFNQQNDSVDLLISCNRVFKVILRFVPL